MKSSGSIRSCCTPSGVLDVFMLFVPSINVAAEKPCFDYRITGYHIKRKASGRTQDEKTEMMERKNIMKKLYSTKMLNTGGRSGEVKAPDNSLSLKIAPPGSNDANATNPEQLFAAGYSACFNSALELVMQREGIKGNSTISVTVSLYEKEDFDYIIGAEIEGHIDGISPEETEKLLKKAHAVCPYSKATRGNIEIVLRAI